MVGLITPELIRLYCCSRLLQSPREVPPRWTLVIWWHYAFGGLLESRWLLYCWKPVRLWLQSSTNCGGVTYTLMTNHYSKTTLERGLAPTGRTLLVGLSRSFDPVSLVMFGCQGVLRLGRSKIYEVEYLSGLDKRCIQLSLNDCTYF